MIREATENDLDEILRMGELFCEQAGIAADKLSMLKTAVDLMTSETGVLLVGEGCMAGALIYPMYMNNDLTAAQEMFWWVDENKRSSGAGKALMTALEGWAKNIGANRMMMIGLANSPSHVDHFYRQNGYMPQEITYWKEI